MTAQQQGGGAQSTACPVLPATTVTAYARDGLPPPLAWSVESHLPACPTCRGVLAGSTDAARLEHNRAVVLARTGLPAPGRIAAALRRCGVPEHVVVLLAATPSLRRSWLTGVVLVLAAVTGAARLADGSATGWVPLVPFLVTGPLLALAAVAAAFNAGMDPAHDLAMAAPVSKTWLLCIRSVAVVTATLLPTMAAAMALPGPWWLAVALLLPALAVCAAAIAAATLIKPLLAAIAAGAGWTALVLLTAVAVGQPALVVGPAGQVTAAAVLGGGGAVLAARRRHIDIDWTG